MGKIFSNISKKFVSNLSNRLDKKIVSINKNNERINNFLSFLEKRLDKKIMKADKSLQRADKILSYFNKIKKF